MAAGFSGSSASGMRAGHAEREAVAAELREHYASGRLTHEELNERLDKAFAAKTRGDLDALMTDLPSAGAGPGWNAGGQGPGARPYASIGRDNPGQWGAGAGRRATRAVAATVWAALMVMALFTFGLLGVFGIGASRPFAIVLILAGLALLRRLLFPRRHRVRACGPRRRW